LGQLELSEKIYVQGPREQDIEREGHYNTSTKVAYGVRPRGVYANQNKAREKERREYQNPKGRRVENGFKSMKDLAFQSHDFPKNLQNGVRSEKEG
jgi:hypothetical protein